VAYEGLVKYGRRKRLKQGRKTEKIIKRERRWRPILSTKHSVLIVIIKVHCAIEKMIKLMRTLGISKRNGILS
jgi:hypothetical protein